MLICILKLIIVNLKIFKLTEYFIICTKISCGKLIHLIIIKCEKILCVYFTRKFEYSSKFLLNKIIKINYVKFFSIKMQIC